MNYLGMLGYSQNEHILNDYGGNPLVESILGVKYKIALRENNIGNYRILAQNNSFILAENENCLPLGFIVDSGDKQVQDTQGNEDEMKQKNSFAYQEFMLSEFVGQEVDVYQNIDYVIEKTSIDDDGGRSMVVSFEANSDKPIWMYCKMPDEIKAENKKKHVGESVGRFEVNGKAIEPFVDTYSTFCTYLGTFSPGEKVTVVANAVLNYGDPWIVYYDEEVAATALMKLNAGKLEILEHGNGRIAGEISVADESAVLLMTLPYMDGYRVRIDGEKTPYGSYRDIFMAIIVPKGNHNIEVTYCPPGFKLGCVLGLVSLVILLISECVLTVLRQKEGTAV